MDKSQILTAALVTVLVVGAAVYRLLWMGPSAAAAVGLRRFPKSPGDLWRWILGNRRNSETDDSAKEQPKSANR